VSAQLFPQQPCVALWRNDAPPKDGSNIIAIGRLIVAPIEGEGAKDPFVASIRWGKSGWETTLCGTALAYADTDTVEIDWWTRHPIHRLESDGPELIAIERRRQVEVEDWTAAHDDNHRGELLLAAADLILDGTDEEMTENTWSKDAWGLIKKHKDDRLRQLVIAGALIAAQIDKELRR
jgi:hypothetical protein